MTAPVWRLRFTVGTLPCRSDWHHDFATVENYYDQLQQDPSVSEAHIERRTRIKAPTDPSDTARLRTDGGRTGRANGEPDPDHTSTAEPPSRFTNPTGDGYLGCTRVSGHGLELPVSTVPAVDYTAGDEPGLAPVTDRIVALGADSAPLGRARVHHSSGSTGCAIPAPARQHLDATDGDTVRYYDRPPGGLYLVHADHDPFVSETTVDEVGQREGAQPMSGSAGPDWARLADGGAEE